MRAVDLPCRESAAHTGITRITGTSKETVHSKVPSAHAFPLHAERDARTGSFCNKLILKITTQRQCACMSLLVCLNGYDLDRFPVALLCPRSYLFFRFWKPLLDFHGRCAVFDKELEYTIRGYAVKSFMDFASVALESRINFA